MREETPIGIDRAEKNCNCDFELTPKDYENIRFLRGIENDVLFKGNSEQKCTECGNKLRSSNRYILCSSCLEKLRNRLVKKRPNVNPNNILEKYRRDKKHRSFKEVMSR